MARSIELRDTPITSPEGKKVPFEYNHEIYTIVNTSAPEQQGFSSEDIALALGINKKLKEADGILVLEDHEWAFLAQRVRVARWAFPAQEILDFKVAIEEAAKIGEVTDVED